MIKIEDDDQLDRLADLAREIWTDYFGTMMNSGILDYLIEKVQSRHAIADQIKDGYRYHFIRVEGRITGYFAYKILETEQELFLSKLYVLSNERRKGIGKRVMQYLEETAKARQLKKLSLTVYHKNTGAIRAYEKSGFENRGLIRRDIGRGIVIEDFRMEKSLY